MYSSVIDALNTIGVNINRNALYKRVEREIKNQKPVEIVCYETMTNLSSITEEDFNLANLFLKIPQQRQANPMLFQVSVDAEKAVQMSRNEKTK